MASNTAKNLYTTGVIFAVLAIVLTLVGLFLFPLLTAYGIVSGMFAAFFFLWSIANTHVDKAYV